ncbi:MAG: pyridoxine 5'-phosphate synthase [Verrucomicrobiota bacterium]
MPSENKILLGVNIDHSATLRQARYRDEEKTCGGFIEPDPVLIALRSELAGADGITVHLREDRRHIQDRDIYRLRESLSTRMNLEMACQADMLEIALDLRPEAVCLVPENRREVTTEGGLDLNRLVSEDGDFVQKLSSAGVEVSLFIDPEPNQIELAQKLSAPVVEFHTGSFARSFGSAGEESEWERLRNAAEIAHTAGITVNAGHGINYRNVDRVCQLPHLNELNIGHSILSRALLTGIEQAVRDMKSAIDRATS